MIATPKRSRAGRGAAPAPQRDSEPGGQGAPSWIRAHPADTPEMVGLLAGAALATLHPCFVRRREDLPGALIGDRLALAAAEASLRFAGRPAGAAELRDATHLLRPGERPGPAGAVFDLWRRAVRLPLGPGWPSELDRSLPVSAIEVLGPEDPDPAGPVTRAGRVLARALAAWPREEASALILAEAALAAALGWSHPAPLISRGLRRGDLHLDGAALDLACHRAVVTALPGTLALVADLARRAERLRAVAPKLRAKAADAALGLFFSEDAVSPSIALAPVVRGGAARMSDRAARRLCDRLTELGVLRELTGRSSFRLYGL